MRTFVESENGKPLDERSAVIPGDPPSSLQRAQAMTRAEKLGQPAPQGMMFEHRTVLIGIVSAKPEGAASAGSSAEAVFKIASV
ncbi:hypothetical protein AWB81_04544 [Caballeronia arationis]|jgi:hypothetical protein|nr:hypothetical protein AWB81_04544 [Caballeronia arationis]